ncbi:unnamed protein product, partial [Prunus brigantina]
MSEKCDHLLSKNVELEHDYRTLKRNWEKNQAQGSQRSLTREHEHTQPHQPEHSHHSPPIQPRTSKGKGPLHPETTKSRPLRISPPRDWPYEPTKVTHLGPPEKPTQLPPGEGLGDSENWGQDYLEDYESYHTEAFEEFYPAHGHPHTGPPAPETLPHVDPAMRLLFEKTDRLYSADDLYMLRQGEDEPLREYAARFSHEYSRCPDTDDRAAFGAFKSGLRESNFRYLVHNNPWNTYAELMKQAAVHAKA